MSIRKFLYAMMFISFVVAHAADRPQFDPKEEGYVETGLPLSSVRLVQSCAFSNGSLIFMSLGENERSEDLQSFLAPLGITEMTLPLPSGPVSLEGHRIFLLPPESSVFFTECRFTNVPLYVFTNNNRLSLQRELMDQLGRTGTLPPTSEAEEKALALHHNLTSHVAFNVNFFNSQAMHAENQSQFMIDGSPNVLLGSTVSIPENCCQDVKDLTSSVWPCSRRAEITFKGCNFLNSTVAFKFSRFLVVTDDVLSEMRRLSALVSGQQPDPLRLALEQEPSLDLEPSILSLRQQPIAGMIMKSDFFLTEGERSTVSSLIGSGIRDLIGEYADEHASLALRMREANTVAVPYVRNLAAVISGIIGISGDLCLLVVNYLYHTDLRLNFLNSEVKGPQS